MRLTVFSDLDGTLLDHARYDFAPARPALDWLARHGVPVVLASSKTAPEIALWQERLGLTRWPAIVENGAALYDGTFDDSAYRALRAALAGLEAPFRGFGDMSTAEVAELTGLAPEDAALARRRAHSEPGLFAGDAGELETFLAALAARGITARHGGRFLTLTFGGTKAGQMATVMARLRADTSIALGDAPNDRDMIEAADYGVIVKNTHGPGLAPLAGEATGRILRSAAEGPTGWAEGLAAHLRHLGLIDENGDFDG